MGHRMLCLITCAVLCALLAGCDGDECSSNTDCDDGVFCNGDESCQNGSCMTSGLRDCNDGLTCTTDSCDEAAGECAHIAADLDGDGHYDPQCDGEDCNDSNDTIFPGAEELCDGLDNDCDGVIQEDKDGDSHFDSTLCSDGDDCDDTDPAVFTGAAEICDGIDNNCDGSTDDEADTDGDSYIDPTCDGDDCDDENASVHPGADEVCNGEDDDCDDEQDETFDCVRDELYECDTVCLTHGTVSCGSDCTFPSLPENCDPPEEACNGLDDDCDGVIDNDLPCAAGDMTDCTTSCGTIGTGICTATCEPPTSFDCMAPAELCNGEDDNCNGLVDETFLCAAGADAPCITECDTTGTGTCNDDCSAAAPEDCIPPLEVCFDLEDNDCDGDIDCTDEDCIGDYSCGGG